MAGALQLEIVHAGGTFTFSVEGEYLPSWEPVYTTNTDPPEVAEMRLVWEFRQLRLVATTVAGLWEGAGATVAALRTLLEARGAGHPTAARLVRVGTPNVTLITLGPPDFEGFLFELVGGETDSMVAEASWRTVAAFTIRVSATKKNEEAGGTGIVGFEQQVTFTVESGLRRIRWTTRVTTKEGTSALTKARTYAAIDVTNFGSDYSYETGNTTTDAGVDVTYTDANERASRIPTVCEAVSQIKQWGINVGTTGPGAYPEKVGYTTRARREAKKTRTEIVISAEGPNAEAWVRARIPTGPLSEDELFLDPANNAAVWTGAQEEEDEKQKIDGRRGEVVVEITGGHRARSFEPVCDGYEPVEFVGAFLPWEAIVSVSVERVGGTGLLSELKMPGKLGAPWVLIENESTEGEPFLVEEERKVETSQSIWRRTARLVYRSAKPPNGPLAADIAKAPQLATYLLPHAS